MARNVGRSGRLSTKCGADGRLQVNHKAGEGRRAGCPALIRHRGEEPSRPRGKGKPAGSHARTGEGRPPVFAAHESGQRDQMESAGTTPADSVSKNWPWERQSREDGRRRRGHVTGPGCCGRGEPSRVSRMPICGLRRAVSRWKPGKQDVGPCAGGGVGNSRMSCRPCQDGPDAGQRITGELPANGLQAEQENPDTRERVRKRPAGGRASGAGASGGCRRPWTTAQQF